MNCSDKNAPIPVFLGLGSNRCYQGLEPVELLYCACKSLSKKIQKITCSSVYKTKAMYYEDQEDFHNMVVFGYFSGSAFELLDFVHQIEAVFGRNRENEFRNGPRSLDVDIEFFGSEKIQTQDLQIPHPRIHERAFVLIPMLEILNESADCININEKIYSDCLKQLDCKDVVRLKIPKFIL